jgi:hypothetical protein
MVNIGYVMGGIANAVSYPSPSVYPVGKRAWVASRMYYLQSQMRFVSVVIAIGVQEFMFVFDAVGGDQAIYRFADRDTLAPKQAVVVRALQRQRRADHFSLEVFSKCPACLLEIGVITEPLQYLRQDQIANEDRQLIHYVVQIVRVGVFDPVEVINPNRGIND